MKKFTFLLLTVLWLSNCNAQSLRSVSNNLPVKEKNSVSTKILGSILDNVYIATTNYVTYGAINFNDQHPKKLKLSSYNKKTLKRNKTKSIKGFGVKNVNPILKDAEVKDLFVKNDRIYVVWTLINRNKSQLILQIFDKDLSEIQQPKIVYELPNEGRIVSRAKLFLLISPDGQKIITGGEEHAQKKENLKLQYKVLDAKMHVLKTAQAELPYSLKFGSNNLSAQYKTDNAGVLFFHTNIQDQKKKKAFLIGKINPENSEIAYKLVSFEDVELQDFDYEIMDDYLYSFGTYTKGVCTFKLDKNNFALIDDVVFNTIDVNDIVYTDYKMTGKAKSKGSLEENTIELIAKNDLSISNVITMPDKGILLVLSNTYFYEVCNRSSCNPFTNISGIHYIKLGSDGKIDWVSCTAQSITYSGFLNTRQDMVKKDNKYYSIPLDAETLYAIDENSGLITKSNFKKKYDVEINSVIDNQFYYVGLNKHIGIRAWITSGASVAAMVVSVAVFNTYIPLLPGVGLVVSSLRWGQKKHDVSFGEYDISR